MEHCHTCLSLLVNALEECCKHGDQCKTQAGKAAGAAAAAECCKCKTHILAAIQCCLDQCK